MTNILTTYLNIYFTEIIVGILIFSIFIVLVSIFHVIFSNRDRSSTKKIKYTKVKKIKYTKEFLKGVDGIDLDLKIDTKKTSTK
ncbi:MAG: hypothetical protein CMH24_02915 [Nitrosomonadales bacterium]|nr:hypothetical protein [Nitrosomonadales bacterium]|tara:strand:- start:9 stop:260 length:252 start_codon:yes stop_codon:yes gene_type:complete